MCGPRCTAFKANELHCLRLHQRRRGPVIGRIEMVHDSHR